MQANLRVVVHRYGAPDRLDIISQRPPRPCANEVRIKVFTAGVAWADIMARRGGYLLAPKPPFTPGYDFAGMVDQVGCDIIDFKPGDYVVGLNPLLGCYSKYLCVPADLLVRFPKHLDPAQVCSLPLNYLTAYCMLFNKAKLRAQQTILVHSAAGGVGSALVQLALMSGLKVFGTASASKHNIVRSLGATPIDYKSEDFVEIVKSNNPNGIDAAFDPIGGANLNRTFKTVKPGGVLVSYGFSGRKYGGLINMVSGMIQLTCFNMMPNGKTALFCALPSEVDKNKQWYRETLASLIQMLDREEIRPIISDLIPLEEAPKAHERLEGGHTVGKLIIQCNTIA